MSKKQPVSFTFTVPFHSVTALCVFLQHNRYEHLIFFIYIAPIQNEIAKCTTKKKEQYRRFISETSIHQCRSHFHLNHMLNRFLDLVRLLNQNLNSIHNSLYYSRSNLEYHYPEVFGQSVGPPLWSRGKYIYNYYYDCNDILYRWSWSP